jgi:hypothetical protein
MFALREDIRHCHLISPEYHISRVWLADVFCQVIRAQYCASNSVGKILWDQSRAHLLDIVRNSKAPQWPTVLAVSYLARPK